MRYFVLAVFAFMLSLPATAQDYKKGAMAFARGDYAAALSEWRPLAEQGNARAQFQLGYLFHYGNGVPQDYERAVEWYRKAAEQGYANGQSYLGFMYDNGLGQARDNVQGHMWFNLAAAQGHKVAIEHRERLTRIMTAAEIMEAQGLARQWTEKHRKAN